MRPMSRRALLAVLLTVTGCAGAHGPDVLTIDSARYGEAFDAAIEAGRRHGMTPMLRDRRRGVIETGPRAAGSLLEPWRTDNASLGQATANTIAYQRRRARFEFTAPAYRPEPAGPDVLATGAPEMDLTDHQGSLELRVQVFVERMYAPGIRRGTWSRANTTRARIVSPSSGPSADTGDFWTPITRDLDYERRLLAAVAREMEEGVEGEEEAE